VCDLTKKLTIEPREYAYGVVSEIMYSAYTSSSKEVRTKTKMNLLKFGQQGTSLLEAMIQKI